MIVIDIILTFLFIIVLFAVLLAFACFFYSAAFGEDSFDNFVKSIISIKRRNMPPCSECKHCSTKDRCYHSYYHCRINLDDITGEPRVCSDSRNTLKCKFEQK